MTLAVLAGVVVWEIVHLEVLVEPIRQGRRAGRRCSGGWGT